MEHIPVLLLHFAGDKPMLEGLKRDVEIQGACLEILSNLQKRDEVSGPYLYRKPAYEDRQNT